MTEELEQGTENEEIAQGETAEGEGEGTEDTNEVANTKESQAEEDAAETDDEREKIRERRRQERHDKKEAQREREASLKRELATRDHVINELNSRLAAVEKRGAVDDSAAIDNAIKQSADGYNYYKEQHAIAVQQQNGSVATDALEKMIVAQRRYEDLNRHKQAMAQRSTQPTPADPRVVNNAKNWLKDNSWYDPQGGDEDSEYASIIDKRVLADGFNPATPQYWEELTSRLKNKLPHRYKTVYNKSQSSPNRSPVAGSGRESAPSAGVGSFKLSPERVQALKDSGKWNDPKERDRMIQYYKNYDKQQSAAGN